MPARRKPRHRFCMVTQGQGLSSGTSSSNLVAGGWAGGPAHEPQALRLGRQHVQRTRGGTEAGRHPARTPQRRRLQATTTRSPRRWRATQGACGPFRPCARPGSRRAWVASSTSARPASSASRWPSKCAAIDPTSVPIDLLNPRPGTKFGDRELIDPWEAVKWIAIFRLILPEALFRLCGGVSRTSASCNRWP